MLKIYLGYHCEQDINECEDNKDVCNYGICVNTNGMFCFNILHFDYIIY